MKATYQSILPNPFLQLLPAMKQQTKVKIASLEQKEMQYSINLKTCFSFFVLICREDFGWIFTPSFGHFVPPNRNY